MPKDILKNIIKEYLWIIVITLVILGLGIIILIPKINEYRKISQDLTKQNKEINQLSTKLNDLNSISKEELQKNYNLSLRAIPASKDFFSIINNFKNIFNSESVSLTNFSINVGDVSTGSAEIIKNINKGDSSMSVRISFNGIMDNVQKAISRLEKSLPLLAIDSFSINTGVATVSADMINYQGDLVVKSIYSFLPKDIGTVDKELPKVSSSQQKLLEKIAGFEFTADESVSESEVVVGKENPFPSY